jgi:hypothetical protein
VTKPVSVRENDVPLYLLPQAVARLIRERGGKVYRISVKRTHWHHYNVSVRTRALPRELRARAACSAEPAGTHRGDSVDPGSGTTGGDLG